MSADALRSWSRRVLALGIGCAAVVGLALFAEIAARSLERGDRTAPFSDPELRTRATAFVGAHPTRGFALTPGFSGRGVRVTPEGFRDVPGGSEDDTSEGLVVLALGDSTTFGWRVNGAYTWPAQLEEMLDSPSRRVRVRNAGVPSYTSSQVLVYLAELLERESPDVLLVSVLWNDLWFSRLDPWYPELLVFIEPAPWRRLLFSHSALYRQLAYLDRTDHGSPSPSPRARRLYAENLAAIARIATQAGVPIFLVRPPFDPAHAPPGGVNYLKLGPWPTKDLLSEASAWLAEGEAAAALFNAIPIDHRLAAGAPAQPNLFIDDIHPNRAGYARIARDVATALRAALPRHFADTRD
jgi:lysophospholipase L1-like esterase